MHRLRQVPALMAGKNTKGLTVVISPLQSLMKDQVDNLEYNNITDAVTINGLLDSIERAEAMRRVETGEAYILYISPESLRSKTIERLLLGRKIVRFVIDEAHCFSTWGQDFRVDYLYIAEFIKNISKQKNLEEIIPVSCFTAKQNFIEDIRAYFKDNLNLNMDLFICERLIKDFKETNKEIKYKSDLMLFIKESSEEDFYNNYQSGISVSTIHKSKGREFDYIILILNDFYVNSEDAKRQLYVGMTRAKKACLFIIMDSFLMYKRIINMPWWKNCIMKQTI